MNFSSNYEIFRIHAFWSKEIAELVAKIAGLPAKSYAGQHDSVLRFVNHIFYNGNEVFNKEFKRKGKKYFDLKVPVREKEDHFEIIELKLRTSKLKYLRAELKKREQIFFNRRLPLFLLFITVSFQGKARNYKRQSVHLLFSPHYFIKQIKINTDKRVGG